jgi:hypothetical protein
MKKIFFAIAIIFATTLVGFAQSTAIHFDNGKYDMMLHPKNPTGQNIEVVTFIGYDAISQTRSTKKIEVDYEVIDGVQYALENSKRMKKFATTELIGLGVCLAGGELMHYSYKQFGKHPNDHYKNLAYVGGAVAMAGALTCILGYIPLLNDHVYVTNNGIGIRYKIKSLN